MASSWHRIFLLACLLAMAGTVGWIAFGYSDAMTQLRSPLNGKEGGHKVQPLSADTIATQRDQWLSPAVWKTPDSGDRLFTPRRFLYFPDPSGAGPGKIQVVEPGSDIKIGNLSLNWLIKNGLPANDPNVETMDPDGDGFTNLDEFQAQTDPRDPKSHPSYAKLLRVKTSEARQFRMTFASVNEIGGDKEFQINTPDGHPGSNNCKKGESFQGFKVVDYRQKSGTKMVGGNPTIGDISELELQNEATGASVVLIFREEQNVPSVSATFVILLPGGLDKPITVQQGKDLVLQAVPPSDIIPPENIRLQLKTVDNDGAKMVATNSKDEIAVPRLTQAESDRISPPAAAPNP